MDETPMGQTATDPKRTDGTAAQPIRLLIAAMGGEGGGVLAGWITAAANRSDLWVQRTSIPGVAQRTGATTYYLEMLPKTDAQRPLLALNPAPGEVDVVLATELLEATRMVQAGYVTPERTALIAASHRVYLVDEKMAMGDGRLSSETLAETLRRFSRTLVLSDLKAVATKAGSQLNAVVLGALAARRILPIEADTFRAVIRDEGKAVAANLKGFEAGLALAVDTGDAAFARPLAEQSPARATAVLPAGFDLSAYPAEARGVLTEGVARLVDYQDAAYARDYLQAMRVVLGKPGADGPFMAALARHLAVRMSVEDVIRVAELKLREARIARVTAESAARPGDLVDITEYFKPGAEEILGLLPPRTALRALAFVARRGWDKRAIPMKIRTTRLSGFVRLWALAKLKGRRRKTLRFAEELAWRARWLGLVERTLAVDPTAAREFVETASLVRGYGDTYKRGLANWTRIADEVVEPMIAGRLDRARFADAVMQARIAASKDPEGRALGDTIAAITTATAPAGDRRLAAE